MAKSPGVQAEFDGLRERALFILAVFDRLEPSPTWARFEEIVRRATQLADLRSINRDLRGAMGGLPPEALRELPQSLTERFGPDAEYERDKAAAEQARARGRIRSEREYRAVQGYADVIAGDPASRDVYDALGALLDEFATRPST